MFLPPKFCRPCSGVCKFPVHLETKNSAKNGAQRFATKSKSNCIGLILPAKSKKEQTSAHVWLRSRWKISNARNRSSQSFARTINQNGQGHTAKVKGSREATFAVSFFEQKGVFPITCISDVSPFRPTWLKHLKQNFYTLHFQWPFLQSNHAHKCRVLFRP